jgi:hypothetical protein
MSIENVLDNARRSQYVAAAAQDEFDYPFSVFDEGDIVVEVDGVVQTISTHYTVDGVGDDTGGTITFVTPMDGDEIVTIYSDTAIERTTDFGQNGPVASASYNDEFDRLFVIAQEQRANVRRALRLPFSAEVDTGDLELAPSSYANKYLAFDADGKPEPALSAGTTVLTQSVIAGLLIPETAAETAAGVTIVNHAFAVGNIYRYKSGSTLVDATNDWSAALQAAVDVSAAGGGSAVVPSANGFYRCDTAIDVTSHTRVRCDSDQATIRFYGCHGFVVAAGAAFIYFENLELFSLSGAGSVDPKTHIAINVNGASGNACNYVTCRDLYLRGWSVCIQWDFTWQSVVDNVTTVNCDTALYLIGQSVNNSVSNSRLVANTGTYSVRLANSGGVKPEGLMIANSLLSSGTYGIFSADPMLALHVSNCIIDLIGDAAIDVTNCEGLVVSNTWLYAANYGVRFRDLGSPVDQSASFNGNRIEVTASGGRSFMVGANNSGININGGTLICGSAGASRNLYTEINAGQVTANGVNFINASSNTSIFVGATGFQHSGLSGEVTITYNSPDGFTGTLTGISGADPTMTIVATIDGDFVELTVPATSGTSDTTDCTITGMPAAYRPLTQQTVSGICVQDNTTEKAGRCVIATDGTITLHNGFSATFTGSGTKGIGACNIRYRRF